ncbi:MAG: hypothetical protein P4L53_00455 [Candidatus Obscuribacterales bacterium]|nr:hypothetical protein [Candidatus Obscuribacterales bacterium]
MVKGKLTLSKIVVPSFAFILTFICPHSGSTQNNEVDQNNQKNDQKIDQMNDRIESAREILEHARAYQRHAQLLIAQTAKATSDAKRLEGNANAYQSKIAPKIRRLNGAQLAQAKVMFKSDLQTFAQHARDYREHTKQVREQVGECHASEQEFERNKLSYEIHCGQYHMQDVAPPHICPAMRAAVGDAAAAQNRLRTNMQKLNAEEAQLAESEDRLNNAIGASAQGDADITKQNSRYLKEQELAAEYATLKEEYRQLEVGRKALQANGAKIPVATVKGQITTSK